MHLRRWLALCAFVAAVAPAQAQQPATAGRIKVVGGAAFIVRGTQQLPAQVGHVVLASDTLRTGTDGTLGVTLRDDTRVSLGPDSELRVERFLFDPGGGQLALALRFVRGISAYVSGRIARLSPDAIRLETPAAIVGVRGTTLLIRVTE